MGEKPGRGRGAIRIGAAGAAGGLALLLIVVLGSARSGAEMRPGQLLPYEDAAAVAAGAEIYAAHCAACHGAALEGQVPEWRERGVDGLLPAPPHDAAGHTWHHADALLVEITTRGTEAVVGRGYRSAMPGFGDVLSADDILAVLAFIKSTWPPRIVEVHNQINADQATFGK